MKASPVAGGQTLLPRPTSPEHTGSSTSDVAFIPTSARSSFEKRREKDLRPPNFNDSSSDENDPRKIILQSFLPRVSVFASADTEELVRLKGIYGGLCGLLRPFGEVIHGNVIIRDSVGSSKGWDDFGIHFIPFGYDLHQPPIPQEESSSQVLQLVETSPSDGAQSAIEDMVHQHLDQSENNCVDAHRKAGAMPERQALTPSYYARYLRKLLALRHMVPQKTFTHPVACVIAISSQSTSPIETLRDLYNETRLELRNMPPWISNEFLRYYLLIHDEDHDDIINSTSLFNQMKRHFGLHCHLLRLRSIECGPNDEDGMQLPACQWLSAEEDLLEMRLKGDSNSQFMITI